MIATILLVAAFVLFLLSAVNVPSPRVGLTAAGLAMWVASILIEVRL